MPEPQPGDDGISRVHLIGGLPVGDAAAANDPPGGGSYSGRNNPVTDVPHNRDADVPHMEDADDRDTAPVTGTPTTGIWRSPTTGVSFLSRSPRALKEVTDVPRIVRSTKLASSSAPDDTTPTSTKSQETSGVSREAWDAKVARAERVLLLEVFDAFELTRVFLRLTVADVAKRAQMSRRNFQYLRRRKSRVSLRQVIALAEAHDLSFTVRVRMKTRRRSQTTDAESVKNPASIDSGKTELTEGSDVRR